MSFTEVADRSLSHSISHFLKSNTTCTKDTSGHERGYVGVEGSKRENETKQTSVRNEGLDKTDTVLYPLCVNCGLVADKEATRYRTVRAIGFQVIFSNAVRRHETTLSRILIRSVFSAWRLFYRVSKSRSKHVEAQFRKAVKTKTKALFDHWRRQNGISKLQLLQNQIFKMQLEIDSGQ